MLSCIIPARNEEGHLREVIKQVKQIAEITQVVIVEGGSTDNTFKEAQTLSKENENLILVLQQRGKGKFNAVRFGASFCTQPLIIIWDADGTVPLKSVRNIIDRALSSGGPVIGNRLNRDMEKEAMLLANYFGNWFFAILWAPIMQGKIVDLLCGTKIFAREVYDAIPEKIAKHDPYGDFTLLLSARLIGQQIVSVPVKYLKRQYGESSIKRWSGGLQLLYTTLWVYLTFYKRKK